jgi:uncharacterized protein
MNKNIFFFLLLFTSFSVRAQDEPNKIVFDISSGDTAVQGTILRQFNNILKAAPATELEMVCHGPAIFMMVKGKTLLEEKLSELKKKGSISIKVCANSMKRLQVDKSELISVAETVPVAILELSEKQRKGWSYIKAGN